jgi:hypothetical protein
MMDAATFFNLEQSEHQFMGNVREHAKARGWLDYHTHIAKRSAEGFPDLVLVRDGRLVFAELKREKPTPCSPSMHVKLDPTPAQQQWLDELAGFAVRANMLPARDGMPTVWVALWRPSDWPEIERVLR